MPDPTPTSTDRPECGGGEDPGPVPGHRERPERTRRVQVGDVVWVTPGGSGLVALDHDGSRLLDLDPHLDVHATLNLPGHPVHAALDPTGRVLAVTVSEAAVVLVHLDAWGDGPRLGAQLTLPTPSRPQQVMWLDRAHLIVSDALADRLVFLRHTPAGAEAVAGLACPPGFAPTAISLGRSGRRQVLAVAGAGAPLATWTRPAGEDAWSRDWRAVLVPTVDPRHRDPGRRLAPSADDRLVVTHPRRGEVDWWAGRLGHLERGEGATVPGRVAVTTTSTDPGEGGVEDGGAMEPTTEPGHLWLAHEGGVEVLGASRAGWYPVAALDCPGASRVLVAPRLAPTTQS